MNELERLAQHAREVGVDGERRRFAGIVMEYRAGIGIIPADCTEWEEQRPRFRTWGAAEDWAWAIRAESGPDCEALEHCADRCQACRVHPEIATDDEAAPAREAAGERAAERAATRRGGRREGGWASRAREP